MSLKFNILSSLLAFGLATSAQAVTITGYDLLNVNQAPEDSYDGTVRGSAEGIPGLVDYVGGGGILNDGLLPDERAGTQSFFGRNVVENASITLYFDRAVRIDSIEFLIGQGVGDTNRIPGSLLELTALGGGGDFVTSLSAEGFGSIGRSGTQINERFDFAGTDFAEVELDSITLRNFFTTPTDGFPGFFLGEIVVNEFTDIAPVPLPASGLLFLGGLAGFGMLRRRKGS